MISLLKRTFSGLHELLYPKLCLCCLEEKAAGNKTVFCVGCHSRFPFTDHFEREDNLLMHHFYGRVKIKKAAALMYFSDGNIVQQMLHNLKYQGMHRIGTDLGEMSAVKMRETGFYKGITALVPVPMHSAKKKQRGYNQSEVIAQKISEVLNLPVLNDVLIKNKITDTQTNKGRQERLDNIRASFLFNSEFNLEKEHILLIDDVSTTGATLEACIQSLQKGGAPEISVFTIAIAE